MQRIVLTVEVDVDEITRDEFENFLGGIDHVVYNQWGGQAQFFFQEPQKIEQEIITYPDNVANKMREYLTEFGVDPTGIVNED
jgi:hypothetical protein